MTVSKQSDNFQKNFSFATLHPNFSKCFCFTSLHPFLTLMHKTYPIIIRVIAIKLLTLLLLLLTGTQFSEYWRFGNNR